MSLHSLNRKWWRPAFGLAVAFLLPTTSQASEKVLPADSIRQNLYSLCQPTESEAFAVGDLGRIFHTSDGGKNWEILTAGTKRPFVAISCTDAKHIWVGGQSGQMARSSDGGKSWTTLKSGTERQILGIHMLNEQVGMAVGDFGTMLRTQDGGDTWTKVEVPSDVKLPEEMEGIVEPGDVVLYNVAFASPEFVSVVGEFGVVLVSTDGGQTFQFRATGLETTLFGSFFLDSQRGWVVGMESEFLSTSDGGATWTKVPVKSPPGFSVALFDLEVRGNIGWAVGNSGFLMNSSDGGATWKVVEVPAQMGSYYIREVTVLPNGKGMAIGSTGLVLTLDGLKYVAHRKQL